MVDAMSDTCGARMEIGEIFITEDNIKASVCGKYEITYINIDLSEHTMTIITSGGKTISLSLPTLEEIA